MPQTAEKIDVACPACGKRFSVAREMAGRKARCGCQHVFVITEAPAEPQPQFIPLATDPLPEDNPPLTPWDATANQGTPLAPPPLGPVRCASHPTVGADFACAQCHRPICATCDSVQPDGRHLCPRCASVAYVSGVPGAYRATIPTIPPPPLPGTMCGHHRAVPAVAQCAKCGKAVCATCLFPFPGGVHLCPACATDTTVRLSPVRKMMVGWSVALAIFSTLVVVFIKSGALAGMVRRREDLLILGLASIAFWVVPSAVGAGLGFGAMDRHRGNTPLIWVASAWNLVVLGFFFVLMIVHLL